jgi:uncharacterized protein (TIRG00374 family)
MKSTLVKVLKITLPLLLGVYLIWYFFNNMDAKAKDYFFFALKNADYTWIILSVILSFFAFLSRAYRWKYMLEPLGYKTNLWNRYHSLMIGYIINLTIPRAGEASRSAMLFRSEGVPFSKSFGTIIAERAVDFVMLLILTSITAFIGFQDFKAIFNEIQNTFTPTSTKKDGLPIKLIIEIVLAIGLIIAILYLRKKPELRKKIVDFVKDIFAGLTSILKSKNPSGYILHTFFIWISYITYFGVCFYSLEETKDFPISGILLGFIAGSLGIMFTNGGIGTFPLLVGLVVNFVMKDKTPNALAIGNAIGMIIWASQTILLIILGLISFILLPKNHSKEDVEN